MIQKDYIMRMVQELASAISKILKLKESHQHHEALEMVNKTFQKLFGVNSALFDSLSTDSIIELLKIENSEVTQKCFWIAELIKEEAEIYESQKEIQISKHKYLKALELYLEGITYGDDPTVSDCFAKIKEIIDKFEQHELPNKTKYKLLRYYEGVKNYRKVEDLLFKLLELREDNHDLIEYSVSFYNRLMTKSDQELISGGLSRDKVINGKLKLEETRDVS